MLIALAPMEGLADYHLRQLITAQGGYDYCVTEFVRVVDKLLPKHIFYRDCPELKHGCQTLSGTPVHIQLLGSDPIALADNAARAAELGSPCVDLNFGCPAKTVNRTCGGAALLKTPERIHHIITEVRATLPSHIPLSAKMRLGYEDTEHTLAIAAAIEAAGAQQLVVHARTRKEGYQPPAHWHWIARIQQHIDIPVIGNGEIWSPEDYQQYQRESGIQRVMLGRGAVATPSLAQRIRHPSEQAIWPELSKLLCQYALNIRETGANKQITGRLKQWLYFIAMHHQSADILFNKVKRLKEWQDIYNALVENQQQTAQQSQ